MPQLNLCGDAQSLLTGWNCRRLPGTMKFGKSYTQVLEDPTYPEEWRKGAIEYNRVRKFC